MGGPLEMLELLTPVMSVTVMILSMIWEQPWVSLPASQYFATLEHMAVTALLILLGALIAFLMVWTEYKVGKLVYHNKLTSHHFLMFGHLVHFCCTYR